MSWDSSQDESSEQVRSFVHCDWQILHDSVGGASQQSIPNRAVGLDLLCPVPSRCWRDPRTFMNAISRSPWILSSTYCLFRNLRKSLVSSSSRKTLTFCFVSMLSTWVQTGYIFPLNMKISSMCWMTSYQLTAYWLRVTEYPMSLVWTNWRGCYEIASVSYKSVISTSTAPLYFVFQVY